MISVFKKIWKFSELEQANIKKSILVGFLHAIFNALSFVAIYYMLIKIYDSSIDYKAALVAFAILLVSAVGKIITQNSTTMCQTHAGYFMSAHKRIEIGEKIKKVPMGYLNDSSLGTLTTIATTRLSLVEMYVPMLLVLVLSGILNTLVFVLFVLIFNLKIGLIAVIGVLVFFLITSLMEKKSVDNSKKAISMQESLTKNVLSTIQGMQVIKSYNLYGENNKKLNESIDDTAEYMLKLEKNVIPYTVLQKIAIGITSTLMIYTSIKLNLSGEILLPDTILMLIASFTIFEGLVSAGSNMAILRSAESAIDSVEYLSNMPVMKDGKIDTPIIDYDIDFENVSFSYRDRPILQNVSCLIPKNTMTAIVGPSGSGKTTFCNLIARFWDVDKGSIKIDGVDVKDYEVETLMNSISMVFQDVYLFNDTIENNIKFGLPEANRDMVEEAAKMAQCHDFIMKLPNGYNTIIGEGGESLSGGEKQRISIARAILKNAPIVIFDEATANVDPENEDKLKEAIEKLTDNKTVIMIAHRLKTIRNADQIIVLNNGSIEEIGNHKQLMQNSSLYQTLIKAKYGSENWKFEN